MDYQNIDYICVECDQTALVSFVQTLEAQYELKIVKAPALSLTMIRAEDSVEKQEFYLGEALTSDCEVAVEDITGYGTCLGDQPQRAYCIAVMDAIIQYELKKRKEIPSSITTFLAEQTKKIQERELKEYNKILTSRVDFKLMKEA